MIRRTENLRIVKRADETGDRDILQQQWVDDDPPDEGAIRFEWRDVPIEELT